MDRKLIFWIFLTAWMFKLFYPGIVKAKNHYLITDDEFTVFKIELNVTWKDEDGEKVIRVNSNYNEKNQVDGKLVPDFKKNDFIINTDKNLLDATIQAIDAKENSVEGVKGKLKLNYNAENILIWKKLESGEYKKIISSPSQPPEEIVLPVFLKIEGIHGSGATDDVKIDAEFFPNGSETSCKSMVSLTVLEVEFMLTFDDGPNDNTLFVIDQLERLYNPYGNPVKCAFFQVGYVEEQDQEGYEGLRKALIDCGLQGSVHMNPDITKAVAKQHIVGNHTQHHACLSKEGLCLLNRDPSLLEIKDEIRACESEIWNVLEQVPIKIFRPPYLYCTDKIKQSVKELNYTLVLGLLTGDGCGISQDEHKKKALAKLRCWKNRNNPDNEEPAVLIFHDTQVYTGENLFDIITYLQDSGFTLINFDFSRIKTQSLCDYRCK